VCGLAAAGLVVASFARFGMSGSAVVAAFLVAVLAVLSAIDLERHILPNRIVLPATAVVLTARIALSPGRALEWIVAALAASGFLLLVHLLYPAGMGLGDVKLALLLGAALGRDVAPAVLVALVAAAGVGIVMLVREGGAARKKAIPLGPFLAFGAVVALFAAGP
jgi:leader peptidase (prepilin peptidase)/N-methyltransferase